MEMDLYSIDGLREQAKVFKKAPLAYVLVALLSAAAVWQISEWHFRGIIEEKDATRESKDATIELLQKQLEFHRAIGHARERVKKVRKMLPPRVGQLLDDKALATLSAKADIRQAFLQLTDDHLRMRDNPLGTEFLHATSAADIDKLAAARVLYDAGYVSGVSGSQAAGFEMHPSTGAAEIRAVLRNINDGAQILSDDPSPK